MPTVRIRVIVRPEESGRRDRSAHWPVGATRRLPLLVLAACAFLLCAGCIARTPFPEGEVVVENPHDVFKSESAIMAGILERGINEELRWRYHEQVRFTAGGPVIRVVLLADVLRTVEGSFWFGPTFERTLTATMVIGGREVPVTVTASNRREDGALDRLAGSGRDARTHEGGFVLPPGHEELLAALAIEIADRIAGTRLGPDWRN